MLLTSSANWRKSHETATTSPEVSAAIRASISRAARVSGGVMIILEAGVSGLVVWAKNVDGSEVSILTL